MPESASENGQHMSVTNHSDRRLHQHAELAKKLVVGRPFGDSDYIHAQLQEAYTRRLAKIASFLPAAGEFMHAVEGADTPTRYRTLEDPVVRCATQHALTEIVTGTAAGLSLSACAAIFQEATYHVEQRKSGGLLSASAAGTDRLGEKPFHGWIWREEHSDGVVTTAFRDLVKFNFDGTLVSPSENGLAVLRQAAQLIEDIVPSLGASALSHVHLVALFPSAGRWQTMAGVSQFWVSGVVFLSEPLLNDPWWVAEHLLHEALHQKLYDLRHTHSVLLRDSDHDFTAASESLGQVVSLWNKVDAKGSSHWGISRSLAALHVYVHLAVYSKLAEELALSREATTESSSFAVRGVVTALSAFRRAFYLSDQIREKYWSDLCLAGQCLVNWLTQCLEELAPTPPRSQLRVSLLLERYGREVQRLASLSSTTDRHTSTDTTVSAVAQVVEAELGIAREILRRSDAAALVSDLNRAMTSKAQCASDSLDMGELCRRRHTLRVILSRVLVDVEVPAHPLAYEMTEAMIERSSLELMNVFSGASASSPSEGKGSETFDARAELLRLTDVIGEGFGTEDFCLFLYSLVRMQAPRTIVELGTGRGASAFWMALGAKQNHVGHVWSVDDLSLLRDYERLLHRNKAQLAGTIWESLSGSNATDYMHQIRRMLSLEDHLTFVSRRTDLRDRHHFDEYPFDVPIDLLFS